MAPSGECLRGDKSRAADCSQLLCAGITRCAVLRGSFCLCIVSVVERCDLTDIKGKIYFIFIVLYCVLYCISCAVLAVTSDLISVSVIGCAADLDLISVSVIGCTAAWDAEWG